MLLKSSAQQELLAWKKYCTGVSIPLPQSKPASVHGALYDVDMPSVLFLIQNTLALLIKGVETWNSLMAVSRGGLLKSNLE